MVVFFFVKSQKKIWILLQSLWHGLNKRKIGLQLLKICWKVFCDFYDSFIEELGFYRG